jgi:hypothetical protein
MAKLLQAIRIYGPKLILGPTAGLDEVVERMLPRTGLNKSQVASVLLELRAMLLEFNARGVPVKLPGVGIIRPGLGRDGTVRIHLYPDRELKKDMNSAGAYRGGIIHPERIGLDDAGYRGLWNGDHPDDPLES